LHKKEGGRGGPKERLQILREATEGRKRNPKATISSRENEGGGKKETMEVGAGAHKNLVPGQKERHKEKKKNLFMAKLTGEKGRLGGSTKPLTGKRVFYPIFARGKGKRGGEITQEGKQRKMPLHPITERERKVIYEGGKEGGKGL